MTKEPLVSIIIANWNGGKVLEECLASLKKVSYGNIELIVVDNASTDGTEKYAQIINSKNVGFAGANNQGFEKSKGKYILLLNNDTQVTTNFLTLLVTKMESDNSIGVIQPKIFMMDKPGYLDNAGSFFTGIGFLEHWGFGQKDSPEFSKEKDIFSAKGACMLIRREVINKLGLFDEDFISYFEESDFCWRVWLGGWRVLFYPRAKIYHKVGFTIRRLDVGNINYYYYRNRMTALIKNLSIMNWIRIFPVHFTLSLGIACVFLVHGNFKSGLMILRALLWNFLNLPKTLRKRHFVQQRRELTDENFLPRLSRDVDFAKFYQDFKRVEEDIKRKVS